MAISFRAFRMRYRPKDFANYTQIIWVDLLLMVVHWWFCKTGWKIQNCTALRFKTECWL